MCAPGRDWARREFVARSASSVGAAALLPAFRLPRWSDLIDSERPHLEVALQAWRWLDSTRIETDRGITWPADPLQPESVGSTLYTHSPGVLPFALELFHSTGDERFLDAARLGADHLAGYLDDEAVGAGLYVGLMGLGFVFEEVYRASGEAKYREMGARALDRVVDMSEPSGAGVAWPQTGQDGSRPEVADIVSGASGTGLGLLWMHERLGEDRALETAIAAGRRLLEQAESVAGGLRWQLHPGFQREYPNFSHGTAGVAYFLATLSERTDDDAFFRAAVKGAEYLQSIANLENDGYRVFHYSPEGEDRYYLSWCHGPVGTNRLFYRLWKTSGDEKWLEWVHRGARGVMGSGVPEQRTPGYWENVSQCGGDAGLGEFFLAFSRITGDPSYSQFAERLNASLLRRSTEGGGGLKWTQSEHRVQPDLLVAQTGFMQGAAGVGKYFLHADAMSERGEGPAIIFPDAPY